MLKMSLVYRGAYPKLVCCAPLVRAMPDGDLITVFQSGGPVEPHPENRVFITRSKDGGTSWSEAELLFETSGKAVNLTELVCDGPVVTAYLFTHNGHFIDWENWFSTSTDSGHTWSEPEIMPVLDRLCVVRNRVVKRNGEWALPYQRYEIDKDEYETLKSKGLRLMTSRTAKALNGALLSADRGKTWSTSGETLLDVRPWIFNENNAVELSDGTMAMLIRSGTGVLYRSDSPDGGRSWDATYPTDIPNPSSKIRLFGLRDGRIALLHNPNSLTGAAGRHPLSLWLSKDDMKSWYVKKDVVTFPGWLAYPDGFIDEEEGVLHFTFDYNRHDVIYVRVTI